MSPKISIIIPSFNKADYLAETLDSIFLQRYQNFEVVIRDGGSTDGTVDIIKSFADRYPSNIKWSSKKDNGQLDAINTGIKMSDGEVIGFINADDCYCENTLSLVAAAYNQNKESLWFAGRGKVINQDGNEAAGIVTFYKNILLKVNKFTNLLAVNYLMQPSVFVTRSAYKKYGPFTGNNNFVTEYEMWLRLGQVQMPVIINRCLSEFRMSPGSITGTMSAKLLKADEDIVKKFTKKSLILMIHKINNWLRVVVSKVI